MRKFNIMLLALILLSRISVSQVMSEQEKNDYYFKIHKSFELYGEIFRELNANYVLEMDPELLFKNGIDGMLGQLDPYTYYIPDEESNELDVFNNRFYVGLGVSVLNIDKMLTVVSVQEGSSAFENGIRIGDRIYSIDSNIVISLNSDELFKYTRGEAETIAEVRILRDGISDTLELNITRKQLPRENVSVYDVIDSVLYLKLDRFTKFSTNEVKQIISEMKDSSKINGIIIDLRNNPGGLLVPAVRLCEMFLPPGNLIVSTKGKNGVTYDEYYSETGIHDTTTPMAVLINNYSASASEVVAGAIQDHDRGVILGQQSFGKGLVQAVINLPYNAQLKITTAKYYTPSGRCIQRINYHPEKQTVTDSSLSDSVFYTDSGRQVYEKTGIMPDSVVVPEEYSLFISDLLKKNMPFKFANHYSSSLEKIPHDFEVSDEIMQNFKAFLKQQNYEYQTAITDKIEELKTLISEFNDDDKQSIKELNKIKKNLNKKDYFSENHEDIKELLQIEIMNRFNSEKDNYRVIINKDPLIRTAVNLLKSQHYKSLLNVQ